MSEDEKGGLMCGIFLGLILCGFLSLFALHKGESAIRKEAVKVGAAHWVADENGNPVFKWKAEK